jgi:hypothetical protein
MVVRRGWLPAVALVCARPVYADDADEKWLHFIERRHTLAIVEAGIIVLPNAPVSQSQRGGNIPIVPPVGEGDATIQLGIHILYRVSRDWAFGANFFFDPRPTSDTEDTGVPRTHSRSYFFVGGEVRYIPLHARTIEGWLGAQGGGVIIADRFTTEAGPPTPAIFGNPEVSLSTEGFFLGAQIGLDWFISDKIVAGLVTRYNHWILPEQPKCSPILDCTTLTGGVDSIDFGFTLGYRISL